MTAHTPPQGRFKGLVNLGTHRFTRFIAAGGEGQVYHLDSHGPGGEPLVGKVYEQKLSRSKLKKLNHMIGLGSPEVRSISAWPVDLLATHRNQVVGFAMPLVAGGAPLHLLRTPKTRLAKMPSLSYPQLVQVAENVAGAVASLNKAGIVVGDINGQNFLVRSNGTIQAIDCVSMQVGSNRDWASGVGVEEYIAPELQNRSLKGVLRTPNHDAFALAVLLFELIVLGRHPFGGHANLTIPEAIIRRAHSFSRKKPRPTVFDVAGIKPTDLLSRELINLFTSAFGSKKRPSAADWHDALQRYRQSLTPCGTNGAHAYPAGAKQCPWCAMEKKGLPKLFNHKPPQPKRARRAAAPPPQPPASSAATVAPAPRRTRPRFTSIRRLAKAAIQGIEMLLELVEWLLILILRLLLTPVSTTRAVTVRLVQAAVDYVLSVLKSIGELIKQIANNIAAAILTAAQSVWRGICTLATILFNIALFLGWLYAMLWIIGRFIQQLFSGF